MINLELENWMPMSPLEGPPLPKSMGVYWPWYKAPAPPEAPIYACPYCGAEFSTEAELLAHIVTAHPAEPPQVIYMCPICGARFSTLTALQEHMAIAHPPPAPPVVYYTCPICGATFTSQAELDYHMATVHPEAPPAPPVAVADIRVEDLTIEPTEVYVGGRVRISVVATNYGDASGTKAISCNVNGRVSTQTVALAPGESKRIDFEATPAEAKTYSVSVNGLTGSFKAIAIIVPAFTFSNVSAEKVIMEFAPAWETMNFFCTITNPNPTTATKLLKVMSVVGQEWTFELTLAPGQSSNFSWYGNTYGQRDPDAYNGPLVGRRKRVCMWLEDEQGNKSAEGCVTGSE